MRRLANLVMDHRARRILGRVREHLPASGTIGDIGSGTGHNAEAIRRQTGLEVREFDVADLHWIGPGPIIFDGVRIPASERSLDVVMLVYVLHYPRLPIELLMDARRIARGVVIVVQSTYEGSVGRRVLSLRGFLWGRLAFRLASWFGLVSAKKCSLTPRRYFTRDDARKLFSAAGFTVVAVRPSRWIGLGVSRDLFVLEPSDR